MSLAGFAMADMHKLTTLDFPGVVSAIVFTQGCNFHCPYCHNPQLIASTGKQPLLDTESVFSFLRKRAGLLDGLVISGGEPCVQTGLPDFCREVKQLGYAVKLDTNGSRPERLALLLAEGLVDYVAMDCKTAPDHYYPSLCGEREVASNIVKSSETIKQSGIDHEFRTTCFRPFVSSDTIQDMASRFVGDSPWFFQKGNLSDAMQGKGLAACSNSEITGMAEQAGLVCPDVRLR